MSNVDSVSDTHPVLCLYTVVCMYFHFIYSFGDYCSQSILPQGGIKDLFYSVTIIMILLLLLHYYFNYY